MQKPVAVLLACLGIFCLGKSAVPQSLLLRDPLPATAVVAGCSQSAAFLARVTAQDATHTTDYQNMICGLVTDGVWSKFDGFYILAAHESATALTNLVSSSFPLTVVGTDTFSAEHGYTGNGTTGYLDTGFIPSANGVTYLQNSAHAGIYEITSRTANQVWASIGALNFAAEKNDLQIYPLTGGTIIFGVNQTAVNPTLANINSNGLLVATRTGASAQKVYQVNTASGSISSADTSASSGAPTVRITIGARGREGGTADSFTTDQISAGFFGGGLNDANVANISSRINTYMTSRGVNVY